MVFGRKFMRMFFGTSIPAVSGNTTTPKRENTSVTPLDKIDDSDRAQLPNLLADLMVSSYGKWSYFGSTPHPVTVANEGL